MTLLSVSDLTTAYDGVRAVDGVSLTVARGETVGLVGESGCGKSSLAKSLLRLVEPQGGEIVFDGVPVRGLRGGDLRAYRRRAQMVFQDPFASLNPRHTIGSILETPLKVHGLGGRGERRARVARTLDQVGLPGSATTRYPHEFSGGQRQRIGIARALVVEPRLVVCDEPVSALDLSVQAQILNLLAAMRRELGLAYLFVSHDLSVVHHVADRVLVMYLGRIVESAPTGALWAAPRHPYTRALIAAVPDPARKRQAPPLGGDLPSPTDVPSGCRFHPRCPLATDLCRRDDPILRPVADAHAVACHHA
ncbi:oligopeptide/dipeptide ABC transporter ATP-binding protein [Methylobacterium sp. 17Sr1-1]|uniref:ABC transporter ATP-binding protein n=1 Tax=Methylobacterium sp. 17Sr1-1 TaxID=2202826 RepID=UPI000D6FC1F3|nr:oligopeptide/dipeptide ABC transporter ATP-binding protein [Methylobacterium sp. 17Sr1-1]AWN51154.1 peptide ABC transporter ATP-binding protein [Methylobacterium sp. 17Sr1-1]